MRIVCPLALLAAFALGASIAAAEPPAGTKNFTSPAGVPNYFSNEAGAPIAQQGMIHHVAPEPAYAAGPARVPTRVAATHRRPARHHAASRRGHRATKLAAAKGKRRATKLAAVKARRTKLATARSGSGRHAAAHARPHPQAKVKPTKTAARAHTPPAKAKQPAHHAG